MLCFLQALVVHEAFEDLTTFQSVAKLYADARGCCQSSAEGYKPYFEWRQNS